MNNGNGNTTSDELAWPPGFAGDIARYLYHAAPRPNREAAIAGTLGLLAGICGRGYTVSAPPTGLNAYVALVMWSAIGKEAIHRISYLHKCAYDLIAYTLDDVERQMARGMVHPSKAASEPGLKRQLSKTPGFVNTLSELGRQIEEMAKANTLSPHYQLKSMMLELFDKSGPHSVIGGINYSDATQNIDPISGPAYSVLGETTPETFYESLTSQSAADGFLSRWTVIERKSKLRPPANDNVVTTPSRELLIPLANMIRAAVKLSGYNHWQAVPCGIAADVMLKHFRSECDDEINKTEDHLQRAIWNRSHLKVYRTAGLFAVADYFGGYECEIEIAAEHVEWAIDLERQNVAAIATRMASGDVGNDDEARKSKVLAIIEKHIREPSEKWKVLAHAGLIADQHLQNATCKVAAFAGHKLGANKSLKETIRALIDAGMLREATKQEVLQKVDRTCGKCYWMTAHPAWEQVLKAVVPPWLKMQPAE